MSYDLDWGSSHPGHLTYLIDLSGSMAHNDNENIKKTIDTLTTVCDYIVARSYKGANIRNRCSVSIIGYNDDTHITKLFEGDVVALDQYLEEHSPMFDITKEAKPRSMTYTAAALDAARKDVEDFISAQRAKNVSIPAPIVIHITDGYPEEQGLQDEQAREKAKKAAEALQAIKVDDGNVLLFNIHITDKDGESILFPTSKAEVGSDVRRQFLFDISSELPERHQLIARSIELNVRPNSRFMCSNVREKNTLVRLVSFGSDPSDTISEIRETLEP